MSLVWFRIPADTNGQDSNYSKVNTNRKAFELIKEKTGLELTLTSETHNDWTYYENNGISDTKCYSVDFKFPDMETAQKCNIRLICDLFPDDSQMPICFVDVENHFFAIISPYWYMSNNYAKGYQYTKCIHNFIIDIIYEDTDGFLKNGIRDTTKLRLGEYVNVSCHNEMSDDTLESLTIVPAFWIAYPDTYGVFIKNMYINYVRKFKPGQKIIDDSGNVFITLGDYLLYYNGKNK